MWCYMLLLFIFSQIILKTNAVNMCTNDSTSNTDVTLNLTNGTGVSGCYCNVKLRNEDKLGSIKPKIKFEVVQFSGCKYKLVIQYNNTSPVFSCDNNNTIFHDMNKTDEIQLYLESTSSQDDTTFEVKISELSDLWIRLQCFSTNITIDIPSNTPRTAVMKTADSTSYVLLTTVHVASTSGSPSIPTPLSITYSSPAPTFVSNKEMEAKDEHDNNIDIGLIGGVAGGVLILVILIIVIIICIVRRRKKKNGNIRDYSRPTVVTRSEHGYTDIDLQDKGNNSSLNGVVIEHVPNDCADPALPQQPNNSENTGNGPVEMIIMENDLYVSSDDLKDDKSRDGYIINQNLEISNGQGEMEIIENDLYVSSDDDILNSLSNNDNAPVYAVVNKKPSDLNDNSIDAVQNDHDTAL